MADREEEMMNLDLNLGPVAQESLVIGPEIGASSLEPLNLEDLVEPSYHQTIREALRQRTRQRWRWRHIQLPLGAHSLGLSVDSDGRTGNGSGVEAEDGGGGGTTLQAGEGSVAPEERSNEVVKSCEINMTPMENGLVGEKEDVAKSSTEGGSFFDCNICLDLAKEPIVTCCGHLFCWPCIYRWLHIHSDAQECPVCKGEVTLKNVTPIYGRGNHNICDPEEDLGVKIPVRPSARRVESLRQTIQRAGPSFPIEEMIRRLGARYELTRDFFQLPDADGNRDPHDRTSMLNRFLTSRALRREQTPAIQPEDVVDFTQERADIIGQRRLPPLTYRRGQPHRHGSGVTPPPADRDRLVEAYLRRSPVRSQEHQIPSMDDRDSFSSIGATIHGESQTVDNAVEIDSMVSLSTLSSRRRNDGSRSSDMDSGDSRALRRRRLN